MVDAKMGFALSIKTAADQNQCGRIMIGGFPEAGMPQYQKDHQKILKSKVRKTCKKRLLLGRELIFLPNRQGLEFFNLILISICYI